MVISADDTKVYEGKETIFGDAIPIDQSNMDDWLRIIVDEYKFLEDTEKPEFVEYLVKELEYPLSPYNSFSVSFEVLDKSLENVLTPDNILEVNSATIGREVVAALKR